METFDVLGGGDCKVKCSKLSEKKSPIKKLISVQLELKRVNRNIKNIEWVEKSLDFENRNIEQMKVKLDMLNKKYQNSYSKDKNKPTNETKENTV